MDVHSPWKCPIALILAFSKCESFFLICRLAYVRSCSSLQMFQSQAKNEGQEFIFFANGLLGAKNPPLLSFLAQRGEIISERLFFIFMKHSCYESWAMDTH